MGHSTYLGQQFPGYRKSCGICGMTNHFKECAGGTRAEGSQCTKWNRKQQIQSTYKQSEGKQSIRVAKLKTS